MRRRARSYEKLEVQQFSGRNRIFNALSTLLQGRRFLPVALTAPDLGILYMGFRVNGIKSVIAYPETLSQFKKRSGQRRRDSAAVRLQENETKC